MNTNILSVIKRVAEADPIFQATASSAERTLLGENDPINTLEIAKRLAISHGLDFDPVESDMEQVAIVLGELVIKLNEAVLSMNTVQGLEFPDEDMSAEEYATLRDREIREVKALRGELEPLRFIEIVERISSAFWQEIDPRWRSLYFEMLSDIAESRDQSIPANWLAHSGRKA